MIDAIVDSPVRHEATDEELRAAWEVCRTSSWPATFEETMADALRARLVHVTATGLARKPQPQSKPAGSLADPECRIHEARCEDVRASRRCANCPFRPPARVFQPPPGYVDRKRLAAGDRDDD